MHEQLGSEAEALRDSRIARLALSLYGVYEGWAHRVVEAVNNPALHRFVGNCIGDRDRLTVQMAADVFVELNHAAADRRKSRGYN